MASTKGGFRSTLETQAVEEHLRSFCEELYALVWKIAHIFVYEGPDVRHEVIQRAGEKIIRKRHKLYTWPEPWRVGYIVTTVRRHHWHVLNQNSRWLFVEDGGQASFADEEADPYYTLTAAEVPRIYAALKEQAEVVLTEDQYSVFRRRIAGKSYKDIAADTGRSVVACRKSMHQSIRKLVAEGRKQGWL